MFYISQNWRYHRLQLSSALSSVNISKEGVQRCWNNSGTQRYWNIKQPKLPKQPFLIWCGGESDEICCLKAWEKSFQWYRMKHGEKINNALAGPWWFTAASCRLICLIITGITWSCRLYLFCWTAFANLKQVNRKKKRIKYQARIKMTLSGLRWKLTRKNDCLTNVQ